MDEQRRARILDQLESDREAAREEVWDVDESAEEEDLAALAAILAATDPSQPPVRVSLGGSVTASLLAKSGTGGADATAISYHWMAAHNVREAFIASMAAFQQARSSFAFATAATVRRAGDRTVGPGIWLRLPFLIPYAVSGIGVGVIWSFILSANGALDQALAVFGVTDPPRWLVDAPLNTVVMIIAAAWQGVGVNALLFTIGLNSIPKEPLEAARVDGATGVRLFGSIMWPMLRPLTAVVVGLSIVASLKTFDIVLSMTRGGPGRASETLALTMYRETLVNSDYGLGSAIAVFLSVVTLVASVLYLRQQLSPKHEM